MDVCQLLFPAISSKSSRSPSSPSHIAPPPLHPPALRMPLSPLQVLLIIYAIKPPFFFKTDEKNRPCLHIFVFCTFLLFFGIELKQHISLPIYQKKKFRGFIFFMDNHKRETLSSFARLLFCKKKRKKKVWLCFLPETRSNINGPPAPINVLVLYLLTDILEMSVPYRDTAEVKTCWRLGSGQEVLRKWMQVSKMSWIHKNVCLCQNENKVLPFSHPQTPEVGVQTCGFAPSNNINAWSLYWFRFYLFIYKLWKMT